MNRSLLYIILAGIWITASEFIRNQLLFLNYWTEHFGSLNLFFSTLPVNGILWTAWSFVFAWVIHRLLQKFSFKETLLLSWLTGFFMMWITAYNLQVLPLKLLLFAIPLSLLEIVIAELILLRVKK